ncbi:MAG: CopG family transcriptional regulator [Lachnoanaerobaculum sp.]|nr:CopG family transcriptional regulator [Lachnoanaerobaculum sp.]
MAKMGRPKAENPKSSKISIRFTDEEYEQLKKCAVQNNQTITEAIRKGVRQLFETMQQ